MLKHIMIAAALAFAGAAHALEIEAIGTGKAEAPATRVHMALMDYTQFAEIEEAAPALAAITAPGDRMTSEKTFELIRGIDPTARRVPASELSALVSMEALMSNAEVYNVANAKAAALWSALKTTRGAGERPFFVAIADDPAALKQEALKRAIADAEASARDTAKAAGLKLGPMLRITRNSGMGALVSIVGGPNMFAPPGDAPKSARAQEDVTVTFDAVP